MNWKGSKIGPVLGWVLGLTIGLIAFFILYRHWRNYRLEDILNGLHAIPSSSLMLASAMVLIDITVAFSLDLVSLHWLQKSIPRRKIIWVGFLGDAIGRTLGFSLFTAGGIKYRFYSALGLTFSEISQLLAFYFTGLWMGFLLLAGLSLMGHPVALPRLPLTFVGQRVLGVLCLSAALSMLLLSAGRRRSFQIRAFTIPIPPFRLAMTQTALGMLKWSCDAFALYVLLVTDARPPFLQFAGIYFIVQVVSILSRAPGGLGVFETALAFLLEDQIRAPALAASLVAYRMIYNVLPFILAVPLYLGWEAHRRAT
jgi:uncharacterized membrane protein YbhN (UPF0104 family)